MTFLIHRFFLSSSRRDFSSIDNYDVHENEICEIVYKFEVVRGIFQDVSSFFKNF